MSWKIFNYHHYSPHQREDEKGERHYGRCHILPWVKLYSEKQQEGGENEHLACTAAFDCQKSGILAKQQDRQPYKEQYQKQSGHYPHDYIQNRQTFTPQAKQKSEQNTGRKHPEGTIIEQFNDFHGIKLLWVYNICFTQKYNFTNHKKDIFAQNLNIKH